jgi:serine/threonine protein kinase
LQRTIWNISKIIVLISKSYVGPEVLLEKPYNKSVDLWSIGIITYLVLCGCLPFDDEHSEREIARQTIHDPVPYPSSIWKKLSSEAKLFVDSKNHFIILRSITEGP